MPETKQPPWMISIEYTPVFFHKAHGLQPARIERGPVRRSVLCIDMPPWRYIANERKELGYLQAGVHKGQELAGVVRGDDIHALFWAVQLPRDHGLTEEEVDMLS